MKQINMVDLKGQYLKIKDDIDRAVLKVIESTSFINGPEVDSFSNALAKYIGAEYVIPCANGTDALQIALMALELKPGDEVIVPAFTYVATAEVIALLGLQPVMTDVDPRSFNITVDAIEAAITPKTKAIVPVHLFGQSAPMEGITELAKKHNLYVVEDNAQALGAVYLFSNGEKNHTGTIGDIGTTSFFPSKNLGCYGDGGALTTNNSTLARKMKMIANHGQVEKYYHEIVGINSRLDTLQAAILEVKLKHLEEYCAARQNAAAYYDNALVECAEVIVPYRDPASTHVFHQYTIQVPAGKRDDLKSHLAKNSIPSMIYYPVPLFEQNAYRTDGIDKSAFPVSDRLCKTVLSLPMHTELDEEQLEYICNVILNFFKL